MARTCPWFFVRKVLRRCTEDLTDGLWPRWSIGERAGISVIIPLLLKVVFEA
jgi:hypothetical protein